MQPGINAHKSCRSSYRHSSACIFKRQAVISCLSLMACGSRSRREEKVDSAVARQRQRDCGHRLARGIWWPGVGVIVFKRCDTPLSIYQWVSILKNLPLYCPVLRFRASGKYLGRIAIAASRGYHIVRVLEAAYSWRRSGGRAGALLSLVINKKARTLRCGGS